MGRICGGETMNFLSDNAYGAAPEILAALSQANSGAARPYGEDKITARLGSRFSEVFERDVAVFPVATGTAANALSLATISPPHGAIFCHQESHVAVDECGATELLSGGARLALLGGENAKITPSAINDALVPYRRGVHGHTPAAISITQATELGTVYTPSEIAALSELARCDGMALHMDGARFANAVAHLECSPADLTWKAGVDVLSFGATKNGGLCADAAVFFNKDLVRDFEYRRKRAGHLMSKMRLISAQLEASLQDDHWLSYARRANSLAQHLSLALAQIPGVEIAAPVEANEIFVRMPDAIVLRLRGAGAAFYEWAAPERGRTLIRLVLSALTPRDDIERFIGLARQN
jgi:threonine aldolase